MMSGKALRVTLILILFGRHDGAKYYGVLP
jgi:hypothetical protein